MNARFSNLRVKGFRHLHDLDLPLGPLNVLIGANGVGKTSTLEVMRLLAASAEGKLQETISVAGGFGSLLTYDRPEMQLALSVPVENERPLEYELSLQPTNAGGYWLQQEHLSQARNKRNAKDPVFKFIDSAGNDIWYFNPATKNLERPNWEHKPFETSLAQVPKMFQEAERFRNALADSLFYHTLDVSPRAPVRLPQTAQPVSSPGRNGENLVSCLYSLRENARDRFDVVEDVLRVAFHGFERMDFPLVAAGTLGLAWRECSYSRPLYAHQLSEGTLRFLWLVTLLQSPELPTVMLIDEPEVSLHPEMLRLLVDLFREAANRTQLIVATHSDRLVRFLDTSELVVFDLDESLGTIATRASDLDLAAWLEEYTLDQLWGLGRLGGRI